MPKHDPLSGITLDASAEARATEHIHHFSESLVTEAKSVALAQRDQLVLPSHIDRALHHLEEHPRPEGAWKAEAAKVLGSILLGVFFTGFFTEIEQGTRNMHLGFVILYVVFGMIGLVALTLSFRDW